MRTELLLGKRDPTISIYEIKRGHLGETKGARRYFGRYIIYQLFVIMIFQTLSLNNHAKEVFREKKAKNAWRDDQRQQSSLKKKKNLWGNDWWCCVSCSRTINSSRKLVISNTERFAGRGWSVMIAGSRNNGEYGKRGRNVDRSHQTLFLHSRRLLGHSLWSPLQHPQPNIY